MTDDPAVAAAAVRIPPTTEAIPSTTTTTTSSPNSATTAVPFGGPRPVVTTLKAPPLPTYASSEQSDPYQTAKTLLKQGDFETALQCLEEGIAWTKRALLSAASTSTASGVNQEEMDVDAHESMAPFHYLYGSTLLYSIEESQDPQQAMTVGNNEENNEEGNNDEGDEPDADEQEEDEPQEEEEEPQQEQQEDQDQQEQPSDDMEIAWENLESARLILTRMLSEPGATNSNTMMTAEWRKKLREDLAQVQLRAGDLQKWNGAYEMAALDYEAALENLSSSSSSSTQSSNDQNHVLLRKRAEIHYNLGAVYLNRVAQAKASTTDKSETAEQDEEETSAAAADVEKKPEPMDRLRLQGFGHYYACAVAVARVIADQAGVANWSPPPPKTAVVSSTPSSKTTTTTAMIRADLQALRTMVRGWPVPAGTAAQESVQLLDELQETIDEAETAELALSEATQLKEQITAAVASQQHRDHDDGDNNNPFNHSVAESSATTTTNAFGASTATVAAAMAQSAAAQPVMMVIKKKKKKQTDDNATECEAGLPPSKRPKNE
jgi:hypothetical protein